MPTITTLMTGLVLGESPRWHGGRLWFSDWGAQQILAVDPSGASEVVARVASFPFCFDWRPDGSMLVVSSSTRTLLRSVDGGQLEPYVDLSRVSEKPWNDIVVDGRGNAYVDNIGFDFPGGEVGPGIIALVGVDGSVRQVADDLAFPNGLAVTADNSTLIVAESYAGTLTAFDIAADGTLSGRRVWAEIPGSAPDGICIDAEGAVWYADVPNRRCARVREGGEVLQTVELDRGCFACMLGGTDRTTLFIVAAEWPAAGQPGNAERTGQLCSVPVTAAGAGWPG